MFKINKIIDSVGFDGPVGINGDSWYQANGTNLMLSGGAERLTDSELVACVLGPGGPKSPQATADDLLTRFGDLARLGALPLPILCRQQGMGTVRSVRLQAALELGLRSLESQPPDGLVVRKPEDVHGMLRARFRGLDREHFLALYLNTRHRIQAIDTVSVGSLNASLVHPREVFKPAVGLSAAAVIVAHNHPSGCSQPSRDDLELTARLDSGGHLLGIHLLDHLIVGHGDITSIREYGWPSDHNSD
jgi:DNA repair protein RadC